MLVPRRVRRRLLLPPGWVALGFLLLLGCQALRPWARQLQLWNVLQLTMPAIHQDKTALWSKIFYQSQPQLDQFRPWYNVEFKGQALSDFLNAAITESSIQKIIADTSHAGGVRVHFLPGATYTNLIRVLDIMSYTGHKKYWLDIRHQPITLYATTDKKLLYKVVPTFSCGTRYYEKFNLEAKENSQKLITSFWLKILALWQQPWQVLASFLVLFGILNRRQLLRS